MLVYTVSEETWGLQGLLLLGFVVGFLFLLLLLWELLKKKPVLCSGPGIQRRESCQAEKCLFSP